MPARAATLLVLVWLAAALGGLFRVAWVDAPRWLHTPAYAVVASAFTLVAFATHFAGISFAMRALGA